MNHRWLRALVLVVVMVLLSACANQKSVMRFHAPAEDVSWPSPPEPVRYRLSGLLTGETNFHQQKSQSNLVKRSFAWLVGLVLGEDRPRQLHKPVSGLVDKEAGRIYVVDIGRRAVFVFDQAQGRLLVWENASVDEAFVSPIAISHGPDNELWVSDAERGVVARLNVDGEPLGIIGEGELQRPTGIARDPVGQRVFVADSQAHDIKVFDDAGVLQARWGGKGEAPGQFNGPTHLAFSQNRLYVTDTLNSRIQVFSGSGEFLQGFGRRGVYFGDMPRPKGIAVDGEGRIYVVESYYDYLLVYDAEGRLLLPIGGTGSELGQFYLPAGVWTDGDREIFVADMFNGRVVSFEYVGEDAAAHAGDGQ